MVSSIVEAGFALLQSEGPAALSTNRIAERAGVSVGSLYQYFADKEAVLVAVYERMMREEFEQAKTWIHVLGRLDLRELMRVTVQRTVERHRRHVEFNGDFYRRHPEFFSFGEWDAERSGTGIDHTVWWFRTLFETRPEELRVSNIDHAAFLVARGLSSIMEAAIRFKPEALFDDAFVEEVIALLTRFAVREA
jgi:AcrR family transcriptional regulator